MLMRFAPIIAALAFFLLLWTVIGMFGDRGGSSLTRKRLAKIKKSKSGNMDIERRHLLSEVTWLNRLLKGLSMASSLDLMIYQAGMSINVGVLLLISGLLAGAGYWTVSSLTGVAPLALAAAVGAGCLPIMFVRFKRSRRMSKFQRQLPEALELIGRSLKAGHAFTQGMRMVGEEFSDPMGPEFEKTLDEINFGVSMDIALYNLICRVDCPDLKFFVVSVNVQRETGGNLAEIVNNISHLVRERFKFHGRVKVLAAEGKLTAYILLGLPIVVGLLIHVLNPDYIATLLETEIGKTLAYAGGASMLLGAVVIKKMIAIKV